MGSSVEKRNFPEAENFYSEMVSLSEIYKKTKHLVLLSEYYNSKQGIVVSTINELRNSLDHIMRALFDVSRSSDELFKAKGHLYRATYDACEVIIIDRLEYIDRFKNSIGFTALITACPDYYTEVLPMITAIKEDLAHTRENPNSTDRIDHYVRTVGKLIEMCNKLDAVAPVVEKNNRSTRFNKDITLTTFSAALGLSAILFTVFNVTLGWTANISIIASVLFSLVSSIVWYWHSVKLRNRRNA